MKISFGQLVAAFHATRDPYRRQRLQERSRRRPRKLRTWLFAGVGIIDGATRSEARAKAKRSLGVKRLAPKFPIREVEVSSDRPPIRALPDP